MDDYTPDRFGIVVTMGKDVIPERVEKIIRDALAREGVTGIAYNGKGTYDSRYGSPVFYIP